MGCFMYKRIRFKDQCDDLFITLDTHEMVRLIKTQKEDCFVSPYEIKVIAPGFGFEEVTEIYLHRGDTFCVFADGNCINICLYDAVTSEKMIILTINTGLRLILCNDVIKNY